MVDNISAETRSANMRAIRSKGMKPEMLVRRFLHSCGYRYRLHAADLPGKPDLVFPARKKVIFVHGCFWHQHAGCREGRIPGSRREYWEPKLARNLERDREVRSSLTEEAWESLVIWECELKDQNAAMERVRRFLGPVCVAS
jgi:DNA mismatch endonuclease (patch repair protein)